MKPLKRLLKIRIDVEKNLRIALAKAISERTLFQRELNEKKQRFMGVSDDFLGILEEGVMVQHLAHFLQYLSGARETIEEDEKVLKKLEEKEEKVRGEVIEAKREREVVQRLDERIENRERMIREKRLERELDDMVSRKKGGERK